MTPFRVVLPRLTHWPALKKKNCTLPSDTVQLSRGVYGSPEGFVSQSQTHRWIASPPSVTQFFWHVCMSPSAVFGWEKYLAPRGGTSRSSCMQTTDI